MSAARNVGSALAAAVAPGPDEGELIRLPRVPVRTDSHEIAEFARATGTAKSRRFVPLIFPVRWLGLPAIRALIFEAIGGDGFLPVHEAQNFTYLRELQIDTDYFLAVEARRSSKPPRLTLHAAVLTQQDEMCMHFETVLRIVPLALDKAS
jgi:hypothetical protein